MKWQAGIGPLLKMHVIMICIWGSIPRSGVAGFNKSIIITFGRILPYYFFTEAVPGDILTSSKGGLLS